MCLDLINKINKVEKVVKSPVGRLMNIIICILDDNSQLNEIMVLKFHSGRKQQPPYLTFLKRDIMPAQNPSFSE